MTDADVAVVGGGPAGAALAARLARRGHRVVLLERAPAWRWRACGVFSSPATVAALGRLGLDPPALDAVARRIPAMRVESRAGTSFRLTYGDDGSLRAAAVGFAREALDPLLLRHARDAGVDVRAGTAVRRVSLPDPGSRSGPVRLELGAAEGDGGQGASALTARIVVGADGRRSIVAGAAAVGRRAPLPDRIGLTFHVPDPDPGPHDARMVVVDDGYVGLAPVPGGRVNVGIVLGGRWRARLRTLGAPAVADGLLASVAPELAGPRCDHVAGAAPLGHAVSRRAGQGWLLVGDAAGFLDPFTGEGLHRALVSSELAAAAIERRLAGDAGALDAYDRAMRRRFRSKDVVSLLVQAFLARPALFDFAARRLAARSRVRETMGLVMGDLVPASRAVDPRFLAALLAP